MFSIIALNKATHNFSDYRSLARNTNYAGLIQANLLSVRIAALDYINEALNIQKQRFNALLDLLESAKKEAISQEEIKTFNEIERLLYTT
ncbi:hypothetical protein HR060_16755 [Catenovulum sp. SM1970]|uniref:hypothetical protein n=1 Tax=Marinifaba aquimaris TaxID=2741323 RepID=UPI0015727F78|nr:hypothetical protein [Marinifaba aquimaris]NTS78496.1 hypothetical protein [Marinifaba aquimaris]